MLSESANALQGVAAVIPNYSYKIDLKPAIRYLTKNQNLDRFEKAACLVHILANLFIA